MPWYTCFIIAQNVINGSGVTYQWQSGPTCNRSFYDITGATSNAYQTTITADTYFQLWQYVRQPWHLYTSAGYINPPSGCYCVPQQIADLMII
jgi:hypothetical protein